MNLSSTLAFFRKLLTRKRLVILLIVFVAGTGIFIFNQRSRQHPIEYIQVKRQNITANISASGTLTAKESADLKFQTSGKIAYINFTSGDLVSAYSVIAGLDATELAIALQQAENNLKDKQAALDKIIDDIKLFQYGNQGTIGETQAQRAARTAAEVARDNAFDSVKVAKEALADQTLLSPIPGIITKSNFIAGQVISPTDIIAHVADTSQIFFDAEVDESDIFKISKGQKAKITLNAFSDKEFSGTVTQIKPFTQTASSGATVIIVRIKLDSPQINFISDLNGQTEIEVEKAEGVLTIPQEAILDDKFVYIQEGKGYKKIEVKTGIEGDTDIEIKEGLSESQKVILNPGDIPNQ